LDIINKRVLVAPLDWGLGHATRCIPLIRGLQSLGATVLLAGEGSIAALLSAEFPELELIPLEGYRIHYGKSRLGTFWSLLMQVPKILKRIRSEHQWLQQVIRDHRIDLVISDNRFGLYSNLVPCIFITHQLTVKANHAFVEHWLRKIQYRWINRYSACWIPDSGTSNQLAGALSHPPVLPKIPVHYLGLISRMQAAQLPQRYRYCFLLSGPEPQRSILESIILSALPMIKDPVLIVRGLPSNPLPIKVSGDVSVFDHLGSESLQAAINASGLVICRGGYTSLMDLMAMQKKPC